MIDLQKIKNRLASLNKEGGSDKKASFLKLEEGKTILRIVPTEDKDPFKNLFFHYNIGKTRGLMCLKKNFNENCSICDFATSLWKRGDSESIEIAKKYFAKERFFSPVIVRGEESEGIKIWGYGKTVYQALLGFVLDEEDYGDITDLERGNDLTVEVKKTGGKLFSETTVLPKPSKSPLFKGMTIEEAEEYILKSMPKFDELFERKTSKEVKDILDQALLTDEESDEERGVVEKYGNKSSSKNIVDEALEELS